MLNDCVKNRQKRSRRRRLIGAGALLLTAVLLRLLAPASAKTVRAWVFGKGELNEAVSAFYACAAQGSPVPDAVEAFCIALEQN